MEEKTLTVSMFPNPAQSSINIISQNIIPKEIIITNALGLQIIRKKLYSAINIDISELKSGLHFVEILFDNNQSHVIKLLKE